MFMPPSKCTTRTAVLLVFCTTCLVSIYSTLPRIARFWDSRRAENVIWRRRETQHLDCARILSGDKSYTARFTGDSRIALVPNLRNLDMSCRAVQNRVYPFRYHLNRLKVGVTFARAVYKDYEFLEKQVQASYHPSNSFCFVLDSDATDDFRWRMRRLARCLPNVHVLDDELNLDSAGHFMNLAHFRCMEEMLDVPDWDYFVLMQNHDVIGKSIYEISRIFELLDGANDVEIGEEVGRLDTSLKWDVKHLDLFRDESEVAPEYLNRTLTMAKGSVQGSLSREAVDWMVRTVDPRKFLDQWNIGRYGVDEQWLATFQSSEFLEMPGHFTRQCLNFTGKRTDFISRWSKWAFMDEKAEKCASQTVRHGVCLLGIEDLPMVAQMPNIMFNKMLPSFDYSIVECTAELLFNRTFLGQEDHKLEEDYYTNMVNVDYHKNRRKPDYKLNCTPGYEPWNSRKYPF